jgi:rubrerythrin
MREILEKLSKLTSELQTKCLNKTLTESIQHLDRQGIIAALRQAIIAEYSAVTQYEDFAAAIDVDEIKRLFQNVANEEKKHIGEFQAALEKFSAEEAVLNSKGREEHSKIVLDVVTTDGGEG